MSPADVANASREYFARIHRAALVLTGNPWDADDLAQETFLVLAGQSNGFAGRSTLYTWLYGVLLNLERRERRRHGLRQRKLRVLWDHESDAPRATPAAETPLEVAEWRQGLWGQVAKLPDGQRQALVLRYSERLTYEEIAEVLECPLGTVKSRLFHALGALRESLVGAAQELVAIPAHSCGSITVMPFEPRLFPDGEDGQRRSAELRPTATCRAPAPRPDCRLHEALADAQADADLPDELSVVAAQLRDDADTLARQHPPRPMVEPLIPAVTVRPRGPYLWPAAALLVAATGLLAWRLVSSQAALHDKSPVAVEATSPAKTKTAPVIAAAEHHDDARHLAAAPDPRQLRRGQGIAEVGVAEPPAEHHASADELEMLQRQAEGFEKLIHRLQAELVARDAAQAENERQIQALRQENEQLRHRLGEASEKR